MDRATLRQILTKHFNTDELHNLYFDLSVDYEVLPDQGKDAKIRELIAHFVHRERTAELVDGIRQARPGVIESYPLPDAPGRTLADKRLESQRDTVQQEWDILSEKVKRLRKAHAVEAGVMIKFQLEQEILETEARLAQLGDELGRIEHLLR